MNRRTMVLGTAIAALLVGSAGCASPLPCYEWRDASTAIRTMNRRDAVIRTISAACRILLESNGGLVELTGALVAQPPNRVRLRAWKFSQVVFDITLNDDGLFVLSNRRPTAASKNLQHLNHTRFVEAIALLPGFELDESWQTGVGISDDEFTITRQSPDQDATIECIVDKNTLVRKRCVHRDDKGHIRQSLDFDAYALFGKTAWPMRIEGRGQSGSFVLLFDRIEINVELAARAFDPPQRAVKLP